MSSFVKNWRLDLSSFAIVSSPNIFNTYMYAVQGLTQVTDYGHRHWSALGALTAIALLAFEPFTQAILSLENRQVLLKPEEYAVMARANN